jgi:hypothetical protein
MNTILAVGVLALVILIAPVSMAPGFAHGGEGDGKSFKIRSFGIDKDGNPYLTVKGTAGEEVPHEEGVVYAYAFVTDAGMYAVTAHMGDDTPHEEEEELEWHSHKVELDGDKCVTSMTEDGEAQMATNRVTLTGTGATAISQVLTAQLEESDEGTCVTDVFDRAKKSKGPRNDIGVLLYTHGDMMNHHGTSNMDRMIIMEEMVEEKFKTPAEVVFHMPYNWDRGMMALDSDARYAVFMYTDMFGPNSTVIHNVTRGVFGGIDEYNYCPGVPMGDACMYMGQVTEPEPTDGQTVLVFAEPARPDHPELRGIFIKQAKVVSENPKSEILVLVGHGARSDTNDMAQQQELTNAALFAKKKMKFADAFGVTAREDWPTLQPAAAQSAVDRISAAMAQTGATRVVLVPATGSGSGFHMEADALTAEGIDYVSAPEPLPLGEKEYKRWAEQVMKETVNFIKKEKPTQATVTPYWSRTY